jgi:hypothetical protein
MHPLHHRDSSEDRGQKSASSFCPLSSVLCHLTRAGGGIRTHIDRITGAAPFCVEPHRHKSVRLDSADLPTVCLAGIEPGTPRFTASYASRYTTDTVNQRRGWESNPQGLAARSLSRRGPSPYRVARPSVVPGGIEPPISSVSGRRLGHSTTGLSVPRPGVEPGLPRSKRGVMSVSPPGQSSGR